MRKKKDQLLLDQVCSSRVQGWMDVGVRGDHTVVGVRCASHQLRHVPSLPLSGIYRPTPIAGPGFVKVGTSPHLIHILLTFDSACVRLATVVVGMSAASRVCLAVRQKETSVVTVALRMKSDGVERRGKRSCCPSRLYPRGGQLTIAMQELRACVTLHHACRPSPYS